MLPTRVVWGDGKTVARSRRAKRPDRGPVPPALGTFRRARGWRRADRIIRLGSTGADSELPTWMLGCGRRFGDLLLRSSVRWRGVAGVAEVRSFIFLNRLQPATV